MRCPLEENGGAFVFDAQMLVQCLHFSSRVGEVSCPARCEPGSSSIGFSRSLVYGLGVLGVTARFGAARLGLCRGRLFDPEGRRLGSGGSAGAEGAW